MSKEYVQSGRSNQKQETRKKILKSAHYFIEKGTDFNLEDVANRSGISRATIYRYFPNVDVLSAEAGLDVSTLDPSELFARLKGKDLKEDVLEVQDYYNTLATSYEGLFRKYISTVLDQSAKTPERGARRKKTLKLLLEEQELSPKEKEDLANLMTVLMGIEPLIVTKDVCGLDNQESHRLLRWGLELLFDGFIHGRKK